MKKQSIKSHLARYSIVQKRKTTINHAFASAIAPVDDYKEADLDVGLRLLGQPPDGELVCVYCGLVAETWDHVVGLVEGANLRGYGHQLGNLVPCCRKCNSAKGAKDWRDFLREKITEQTAFESTRESIRNYIDRFAVKVDLEKMEEKCPEDWKRYCEIKNQIFELMEEADGIAYRLRDAVLSKKS